MKPPETEQQTTKKQPEIAQEHDTWADPKVLRWFKNMCSKHFDIGIEQLPVLKSLDVYGVKMLKKERWKEMSPEYGHIFFSMWQDDQQTFGDEAIDYYEGPYCMECTFTNLPTVIISYMFTVYKKSSKLCVSRKTIKALKLLYTSKTFSICVMDCTCMAISARLALCTSSFANQTKTITITVEVEIPNCYNVFYISPSCRRRSFINADSQRRRNC